MTPATNTIDIAFVLDCTASMQPWINAAKRQIHTTLDGLRNTHPNWNFQIALILYRDYGDEERRTMLDFTDNWHRFDAMLDSAVAEGGDDTAEDFAGAMWMTARLSWTGHVRHVFVLTDAPAHGKQYHDPRVSDRFPDGDPDGRVVEDEVDTLTLKRVNMTFVRIRRDTDILITRLRRVYNARAHRGAIFEVEDLPERLPPPPWGLEREGAETIMGDELSPLPDVTLSRMVSRAVTQSLSVYDRTE